MIESLSWGAPREPVSSISSFRLGLVFRGLGFFLYSRFDPNAILFKALGLFPWISVSAWPPNYPVIISLQNPLWRTIRALQGHLGVPGKPPSLGFGVPYFNTFFLKEPLWNKSLYFFLPGYLRAQKPTGSKPYQSLLSIMAHKNYACETLAKWMIKPFATQG